MSPVSSKTPTTGLPPAVVPRAAFSAAETLASIRFTQSSLSLTAAFQDRQPTRLALLYPSGLPRYLGIAVSVLATLARPALRSTWIGAPVAFRPPVGNGQYGHVRGTAAVGSAGEWTTPPTVQSRLIGVNFSAGTSVKATFVRARLSFARQPAHSDRKST